MRYLWVEDFGEDSENQEDMKKLWERYFSIQDNILLHTLEDTLYFLDNAENRMTFDIVLLDIRFPVLKEESDADETEIYNKYFSSFLTKAVFNQYGDSELMKDASSGILLFLALIFRYGYSWNNIAFISANVDNEDLSAITVLKELIIKAKYTKELSNKDKALYKTKHHDLFSEDDGYIRKKLGTQSEINILDYEELMGLVNEKEMSDKIRKLNTLQNKLNNEVRNSKGLKYCSVRDQFQCIGLKMPPAFEKPTDESQDTCWLFKDWIEAKSDKTTIIKRSIIEICTLLIGDLGDDVKVFLEKQRKYNDNQSIMTEETIRQYLKNIQRNAVNYPDIRINDNEVTYATYIVEAVVSEWVNIKKPHVQDNMENTYYEFAYYSVMKLTRNWLVHQGIKGIDIVFAAFVFVISIKGIFDIEKKSCEKQKKIHGEIKKLIDMLGNENNSVNYSELDVDKEMETEYNNMYNRVQGAIPCNDRMPSPSSRDPFSLLSRLGHEDSCFRKSVSVNEIYKVFWMTMYFGDKTSNILSPAKNKDKELIGILENTYLYQR